jgi:hypothetical protein
MRRPLALLLLLALAPSAAPAQSVVVSPARPQRTDAKDVRVFDIRDFGAKPNDTTSDAMGRTSVDRAWDALMAAIPAEGTTPANTRPVAVYFPAGRWCHYDPLLADRNRLTICGEGDATQIVPLRASTSFQFGLRRTVPHYQTKQPVSLSADHWFDLYGKLDSSIAGFANTRFGLRTKGDSHLTFHSSPWNAADFDYYATTRQLTFDFCLDGRGSTIGGGQTDVLGPACSSYGPQPFGVIMQANNAVLVIFRTAEMRTTRGWRQFSYQTPTSLTGLQKHAIQIDLANAAVSAFVGGVQVATSSVTNFNLGPAASTTLPFTAGSNLSFRPNYYQPFNVGTYSVTQGTGSADGQLLAPADFSLCGMKLSNALRYKVGATGDPQQTPTGGAVNDLYRYGDDGANTMLACLTLADPPSDNPNCRYGGRMVHWKGRTAKGGSPVGNGWFMSTNSHNSVNAWTYNNVVKDLTVSGQQPWGDGISLGAVGGLCEVKHVAVEGGFFRSLGGMGMGSSYPIEVTGCRLDGAFDAAYEGESQILNRLDFTANQMGTTGLRIRGSQIKSSNMYLGGQSTFSSRRPVGIPAITNLGRVHAGNYASTYSLTFDYDGEDGNVATQVDVDNASNQTTVALRDCKFATQPTGPAVLLRECSDIDLATAPLRFSAEGTTFGGYAPAFVQTEGPLARGEIRGGMVPPTTMQHVKNVGPNGVGNVRWAYPMGEYPPGGPTAGTWSAGCFLQPNPDGTTTYCTSSGTFGTGTLPNFATR